MQMLGGLLEQGIRLRCVLTRGCLKQQAATGVQLVLCVQTGTSCMCGGSRKLVCSLLHDFVVPPRGPQNTRFQLLALAG
jgi:hypothetical protein